MSLQEHFFENKYEEYAGGGVAKRVLNSTNNGLSTEFKAELEKYIKSKEAYLTKEMESDIFYDRTVYTGSAGLALYNLMYYLDKNDVKKLHDALEYLDVKHLKGKRISFLCGDAGPLALGAIISYKLNNDRPKDISDYKTLTQRLMSLISIIKDSPDEILYGKSGYLFALLFVNKHIGKEVIPASHVDKVIKHILNSGKEFSALMKSSSPLLWQWHDKIYLGAAHGIAGILYMLLQARAYIDTADIHSFIKPTLDWLLNQQFPSGNFPSSLGSSSGDRLVQWCHGAPGFVSLCLLAHQVFKEEKYKDIALKAGEVVWQRGLVAKGYSICHGVSGNAFAFIQLYQATKDPVHLYRASRFLDWTMAEAPGTKRHRPDRPASLFEGLAGCMLAAHCLLHFDNATFPAFTL